MEAISEETCRLCGDWLHSVGVLGRYYQLTAKELAFILHDGILLCDLLNKLSPGIINSSEILKFGQNSRYLADNNIKLFLNALKYYFEFSEHDLFQPGLLYEKETHSVTTAVKVLSKLSKLPKVQAVCKHSGFHVTVMVNDDENFYDVVFLEELYAPAQAIFDELNDSVYDKIMLGSNENKHKWKLEKREQVLSEIFNIEERFVKNLQLMLSDYTIKAKMTRADKNAIFGSIEILEKFHSDLLIRLRIAINGEAGRTIRVCNLFNEIRLEMIHVYIQYYLTHTQTESKAKEFEVKNQKLLESLRQKPKGEFIKDKLTDLVNLPFQHSCRYHLLFDRLLKETQEDHVAKNEIEKTWKNLEECAHFLNKVKKNEENLLSIDAIKKDLLNFDSYSIYSYGELLKDDNVKIKESEDIFPRTRSVLFFEKALLIFKKKYTLYHYRCSLPIDNYEIDDGLSGNSSELTLRKMSGYPKTFIFSFKNEAQKVEWKKKIIEAMKRIKPQGYQDKNHDFQLWNFHNEVVSCSLCSKLLPGIFYQGYKCQKCLLVVHEKCILNVNQCLFRMRESSSSSFDYVMPNTNRPSITSLNGCVSMFISFKVRAIYPYQGSPAPPNNFAPLKFSIGDVIQVTDDDDNDWWKGKLENSADEAYFPNSFVEPDVTTDGSDAVVGDKEKRIEEYDWFSDCDHETAMHILERLNSPSETLFLVRPSKDGGHCLSIKYDSNIGHIRILSKKTTTLAASSTQMFYIAESCQFRSIPQLISYYMENSLKKSFPKWPTRLHTPFRKLIQATMGVLVANQDYKAVNTSLEIDLRQGSSYFIIKKQDLMGWCLVSSSIGLVGYAPGKYLQEI